MKITYDPYADAMYIHFRPGQAKETIEMKDDYLLDQDEQNYPLGVEILRVSEKLPSHKLKNVEFEFNLDEPRVLPK